MLEVHIITNHHWRPLLSWFELSEKQRAWVKREHDWLEDCELSSFEDETYLPYRDWIYCLSDFERPGNNPPTWLDWDGYLSDSFFSGIMIRLSEDCDAYQIATFYS